MQTRDISYTVGGKTLTGYLATPDGVGKRAGVLVCHQGNGVTEHTRERARMIAEEGHVGFALDMYGETATSREQAMALLQGLTGNPEELRRRALAGLAVLKDLANVDAARLAAIGYCFGGAVVLELARAAPELKCVVAFHPGMAGPVALADKDDRKIPSCKVMVCAGADDPLIPDSARVHFAKLMNAAGADWQFLSYGGAAHSFTDRSVDAMNMPGFKFDARTDRRSWAAMKDLFSEALVP
ncbi:MAG TPA: dienelactone hydrolase family protein [Rhizomicrobium sp.]|nr:dienelactone hydrolase family protein [Rhizomicrobium sp.]